MGLLDIFKKRSPTPTEITPPDDSPAHGWDAITQAFQKLYPGQTNPPHRAPMVYRMHDLSENAAAYDGVSAYNAGDHWHFVTYGLTELYGKEGDDHAVSGFGYEFTFKIPKAGDTPPLWAFDFLEAIGKQVWKGAGFAAGHTIKTGPLDGCSSTAENAVLVVRDPSIPEPIETPNGKVQILLLVGVEDAHRQKMMKRYEDSNAQPGWEDSIVAELRENNPALVTPIRTEGAWGGR